MSSKNGSCVEDDCWGFTQKEHALSNGTNDIYTKQLVNVDLWYHTTVIVFLTTLGINGTLLNGLVLRYFWYRRQNLNSYNIVLINLAFVELLLATIGVSFDVISLIRNGWFFGKEICIIGGTIVTTSGFVSISTLSILSVFGYQSVTRVWRRKNKRYLQQINSPKIIVTMIWLYALLLSIPPVFGWGRYVPEISGLGCAPDWHSTESEKSYVVYIMFFGFCIPTLIMTISSLLTYVDAGELKLSCTVRDDKKRACVNKADKSAEIDVRLIVAMNFAYLTCWMPYAILCFIHIFVSKTSIGPMLSMVPTLTVKISVCANPILYIAYNPLSRHPALSPQDVLDKSEQADGLSKMEGYASEHIETAELSNIPSLRYILHATSRHIESEEIQKETESTIEKDLKNGTAFHNN